MKTITEFSELTKIAYHTLYKYKDTYTDGEGMVDMKRFTKFIANGGLPRLSNRTEVIESCQSNGLAELAKLFGQTQPMNLWQLSDLSGIAYHTLMAQWTGDITVENFLSLLESGKWQKIANRQIVREKALQNSVLDPSNKTLWLKVSELFRPEPIEAKRQCRIWLTEANAAKLEQLSALRTDKSKINAFSACIADFSLTFQQGDAEIEVSKKWRPRLPISTIAIMDEMICNHLVHLEPINKIEGHKIVANWAIEAI